MRQAASLFLLTSIFIIGAHPTRSPIASAIASFHEGQFQRALSILQQTEGLTDDPGRLALVAGVTRYRLGDFRNAELNFRQCLEDATGRRQILAMFYLACCLVQQADNRVDFLTDALRAFRFVIDNSGHDHELNAIARNNLELTKLLLAQISAEKSHGERQDDSKPQQPDQPNQPTKPEVKNPDLDKTQALQTQDKTKELPKDMTEPTASDQPPPPGAGKLPVLLEDDRPARLSPEDARQYVRRAVERVAAERKLAKPPAGKSDQIRDW